MHIKIARCNDDRKDWYEIKDEGIKKDAGCAAVIFMNNGVNDEGNRYSILKTKNYGKLFNLCECERFRDQSVAAVPFFTGFLVKEDVIATAGHCVHERKVASLRIIFGYKMIAPFTPVTEVPKENVYKAVKIIDRVYKRTEDGQDWALLKLDRKVKDQEVATLSRQEISINQSIHVIGHPVGLPLKYAAGTILKSRTGKAYFTADLNIYSGNSGSPVFNSDTHEVIGMVVRGYDQNFRLAGNCWVSIGRPDLNRTGGVCCTNTSEFIDIVETL